MRQEDNSVNIYEASFSFDHWQITAAPHRLTFGTTQEESPSVSADGSLVFASIAVNLDVYGLPVDVNRGKPTGPLERFTSDLADDSAGSLSADGGVLAFFSLRSGRQEIWVKNLASGTERMLTTGRGPKISPDGTLVAYLREDEKTSMIIPTEGGVSRQFGSRAFGAAAWSSDNSLLLLWDELKPKNTIEILDVASGRISEYLTHPRSSLVARGFSPDGRWISFSKISPEGQVLMVAPFRISAPPPEAEWFSISDSLSNDFHPRWSPNGQILYFISERDGFACLWARRMDPATQKPRGESFPVLHLHGALRRMRAGERYLSVAKDKLAFSMEERAGSIWMLQFK
jgi:Tol biopolymer transport system component